MTITLKKNCQIAENSVSWNSFKSFSIYIIFHLSLFREFMSSDQKQTILKFLKYFSAHRQFLRSKTTMNFYGRRSFICILKHFITILEANKKKNEAERRKLMSLHIKLMALRKLRRSRSRRLDISRNYSKCSNISRWKKIISVSFHSRGLMNLSRNESGREMRRMKLSEDDY